MSYCRRDGYSGAYIINYPGNNWACIGCRIIPKKETTLLTSVIVIDYSTKQLHTLEEVLAHMKEHQAKGQTIPKYAIKRIKREIKERDRNVPQQQEDNQSNN